MGKFVIVRTDFWRNSMISEMMTNEERYFYLYLLTNSQATKNGIYHMTVEEMANQVGFSIETVQALIDRFTVHHKLIQYNSETSELVLKQVGNLYEDGDTNFVEITDDDGEDW